MWWKFARLIRLDVWGTGRQLDFEVYNLLSTTPTTELKMEQSLSVLRSTKKLDRKLCSLLELLSWNWTERWRKLVLGTLKRISIKVLLIQSWSLNHPGNLRFGVDCQRWTKKLSISRPLLIGGRNRPYWEAQSTLLSGKTVRLAGWDREVEPTWEPASTNCSAIITHMKKTWLEIELKISAVLKWI